MYYKNYFLGIIKDIAFVVKTIRSYFKNINLYAFKVTYISFICSVYYRTDIYFLLIKEII